MPKLYKLEKILSEVNPVTSDGEEIAEPISSGEEEEDEEEEEDTVPPPLKRGRLEEHTGAEQKAKDGTVWREQQLGRPLLHRPIEGYPADGQPAVPVLRGVTTRLQSFLCFITLDMLRSIQQWTIQHGQGAQESWFVSVHELMAFIAIVFLRGVTKRQTLQDSWSEKLGNPLIMKIMARHRFQDIMRHLRFDDKETRAERVETDKFAAISNVWSSFVANCISSYNPGRHIAIDEQLFPTKTRCCFLQNSATKPDKFGMKFWVACDMQTKYVCNMIPCLGKDPSRATGVRVGEDAAMKLMQPFLDKGRTVITKDFFMSLGLAEQLLQQKTTVLGEMNKVRRELPGSAKQTLGRQQYSTQVFSTSGAALTVYAPKPKKIVCILSSMHGVVETTDTGKKKPNTVTDYNTMKRGVDVMDQMVREYTVRTATQRWPVAVFYNMLDIAALNAHILYQACTGVEERRVDFLVELAQELAHSHVGAQKASVKTRLWQQPAAPEPGKRAKCQVKRQCNRNHATMRCADCYKYTCGRCRKEAVWKCHDCAA
ncbi:piggyBac transposable element-derived protein 4-like [Salarias fasciatus]|uniref:piggyBac transposable element-derived protein 4-like n=1 Tax=Salarias fasciatus TaxID=181472 RepID=UPI00117693AD|nr:piggyBac transposable element-derived protein 4-like [Salarias fasciatus]